MKDSPPYLVKKGPADPFRGDWYILTEEFASRDEAIQLAGSLTLANFKELQTAWEEFGYEWSVFEKETEKKIWEGYKFIREMTARSGEDPDFNLGEVD